MLILVLYYDRTYVEYFNQDQLFSSFIKEHDRLWFLEKGWENRILQKWHIGFEKDADYKGIFFIILLLDSGISLGMINTHKITF